MAIFGGMAGRYEKKPTTSESNELFSLGELVRNQWYMVNGVIKMHIYALIIKSR